MSARLLRSLCLLSCVLLAASALAQEGHPAKGTWVGLLGTDRDANPYRDCDGLRREESQRGGEPGCRTRFR